MSRKREEQREKKKALEQQLGLAGKQDKGLVDDLLAKERVTEPSLHLRFEADAAPKVGLLAGVFGRLQKAPPPSLLSVRLALLVIEPGHDQRSGEHLQARPVGVLRFDGTSSSLSAPAGSLRSPLRYRRPGGFVVIVDAVEASTTDAGVHAAHDVACGRLVEDGVVIAGVKRSIASLLSQTTAMSASLVGVADDLGGRAACAVLGIPAADRVKTTVVLPLPALKATAHVDVRL